MLEKLKGFGTLENSKGNSDIAVSNVQKMAKAFIKGYWAKFNSAITLGDAYGAFPERFKEDDNSENYPPRNYKY